MDIKIFLGKLRLRSLTSDKRVLIYEDNLWDGNNVSKIFLEVRLFLCIFARIVTYVHPNPNYKLYHQYINELVQIFQEFYTKISNKYQITTPS